MTESAVVRARIDPAIKIEASAVLKTMGLTLSDAFRMLMMRVVADKALPFDVLTPNAETISAIHEAKQGKLKTVKSIKQLFASLDASD